MSFTKEDCYRGGMKTFELYGSEHYRRITKGRPRLPRFSEQPVSRPPRKVAKGSPDTTTEGGTR